MCVQHSFLIHILLEMKCCWLQGEGGLLQVTLEGINLKFMHNQVGTSGSTRLPSPVVPSVIRISVQDPSAFPVSMRASEASGRIGAAGPERNQRGGHSDIDSHLEGAAGSSHGGLGERGPQQLGCLHPLDSAQCEWERLTWPSLPCLYFLFPGFAFAWWFCFESLDQLISSLVCVWCT